MLKEENCVLCRPGERFLTDNQGKCWNERSYGREYKASVRSVMRLYEGAKARVRVDSEISEEV